MVQKLKITKLKCHTMEIIHIDLLENVCILNLIVVRMWWRKRKQESNVFCSSFGCSSLTVPG